MGSSASCYEYTNKLLYSLLTITTVRGPSSGHYSSAADATKTSQSSKSSEEWSPPLAVLNRKAITRSTQAGWLQVATEPLVGCYSSYMWRPRADEFQTPANCAGREPAYNPAVRAQQHGGDAGLAAGEGRDDYECG